MTASRRDHSEYATAEMSAIYMMSAMAGMIAVGESTPPIKNPTAVRTRPPTKNCQPASKTPSCSREKMPMRQVDRAPATVEAKIKPSPLSVKPRVPFAPERLTSATPAKPSTQPSTLATSSFSVRNARAAKRMARKLALASMMELDMALARESPR